MKARTIIGLFAVVVTLSVAVYSVASIQNANLVDWNGNLVADFGDNGLWYHNGTSWNWMSNDGRVGRMAVWNDKLVVDFGAAKGLWYYDGTWHWMTNRGGVSGMIAWNSGAAERLVVDFGAGQGVFTYDGAWQWLSNKDAVNDMTVWNQKLVMDFGADRGLYYYDTAWHWMTNKDNVNRMIVWNNGAVERLVVDFGSTDVGAPPGRIYTYNGAWTWLSNKDCVNQMAVWNQKLVVDFSDDRGLYCHDTAWHWMTNKDNVNRMAVWNDGAGDKLTVDFGGGRNMYTYDGSWHWIRNANDVPEMISWNNGVTVDLGADAGLYFYDGVWQPLKEWSTEDPVTGLVPDTGQATCYDTAGSVLDPCPSAGDDFYGQDACYTINPPAYTKLDNVGNELPTDAVAWAMVKDNVTGLIWEVKNQQNGSADYGNPHDADNTYTWYDDNSTTNGGDAGTPGAGTDTEDFIDNLNSGGFGGYSDWRMPTIIELYFLTDAGRIDPAIDIAYFPRTMASTYWSATTNAAAPGGARRLVFTGGWENATPKSQAWHVRAVHGSRITPSFTDNGDDTVTDNITGLMWTRETANVDQYPVLDENDRMTWQQSLAWCESLDLAGHDDWRLPTRKEMKSIVDHSAYAPSVNTTYFPDTRSSGFYWTSTTAADQADAAWYCEFNNGYDYHDVKTAVGYVRAVCGGQ
jgi:hypothetical protein